MNNPKRSHIALLLSLGASKLWKGEWNVSPPCLFVVVETQSQAVRATPPWTSTLWSQSPFFSTQKAILTLLKKSQELVERDPELNGPCECDLNNSEFVGYIRLVVDWYNRVGQAVFEVAEHLDWEEMKALGEAIHIIWLSQAVKETFARRDQFSIPGKTPTPSTTFLRPLIISLSLKKNRNR